MRFFIPASEVIKAARELEAADRMPGGYVFVAEPIDETPPPEIPVYRCKYHDTLNCFTCQYQNVPVGRRP